MKKKANRKHKDRLFVFLFGNEKFKEFTLSLYNAINNTDYKDKELIEFNRLDDFLYMGVKNDVSFVIADTMNVYEHQSTLSDNLPFRMVLYTLKLYEPLIEENFSSIYKRRAIRLPKPRLIAFYNGEEEIEDERILLLSDMFEGEKEIEARVRLLNINYGHNRELLQKCRPLMEYSKLIYRIRENHSKGMGLYDSIDDAIIDLEDDSIIKPFIVAHKREVVGMLFSAESDRRQMEKLLQNLKDEAREEAREEIRKEAFIEGREEGFIKGSKEGFIKGSEQGFIKGSEEGFIKGSETVRNKSINMLIELGYSKEEALRIAEDKLK